MNRYLLSIMICLIVLNLMWVGHAAAETLNVGYTDWPPFSEQRADERNPVGLDIDLISAILKRAGFEINFKLYPWKRILQYLKHGQVDIGMSAGKNMEREKFAYFSESYFRLGYNVLFIRAADKEKYCSITSLKDMIGTDFRLGVRLGWRYSDEFEDLLNNDDFKKLLQKVPDDTQNIKKLVLNRIDGFLAGEFGGALKIKKMDVADQVTIKMYLYDEEEASTFLMFSKKSMTPEKVNRINTSLNEMKSDGSHQAILAKYQLGKLD